MEENHTKTGACNPYAPHGNDGKHEGCPGVADPVENALKNDQGGEHGLGNRNDAKHRDPSGDNLRILRKQRHHLSWKSEQKRARDGHQGHGDGGDGFGHLPEFLFILFSQGVARHGGGGRLHAVTGDVEGLLRGDGDGMGGKGQGSQPGDKRGENHLPQTGADPLHSHRRADPQAFGRKAPVKMQRISLRR